MINKIDKCAFNTFTEMYQSPIFADKKYLYLCPDPLCNEIVFLRKGEKNRAHFCHKKNTYCRRYDTGLTESELHKEAKYILRDLISRGYNILFKRKCNGSLINENCDVTCLKYCSKLNENQKLIEEYSTDFNGGKIIPDLAMISYENDIEQVDEIYEIFKTHRTKESDRPSYIEWYEIKAEEICNKVSNIKDDKKVVLDCIRVWQCEECALADEKEKRRLIKLEQDEYNMKCAKKLLEERLKKEEEAKLEKERLKKEEEERLKKEEEESLKQEKEEKFRQRIKLNELNQELKVLGKRYDGYAKCSMDDYKLTLDINTLIKMPEEEYSRAVKKYFPKYKYDKDICV